MPWQMHSGLLWLRMQEQHQTLLATAGHWDMHTVKTWVFLLQVICIADGT